MGKGGSGSSAPAESTTEDTGPYMSEAEMDALDAAGFCVNCGHTKECHRTTAGCPSSEDMMTHDCPPNTSDSEAMYDLEVMGPIRRFLAERRP